VRRTIWASQPTVLVNPKDPILSKTLDLPVVVAANPPSCYHAAQAPVRGLPGLDRYATIDAQARVQGSLDVQGRGPHIGDRAPRKGAKGQVEQEWQRPLQGRSAEGHKGTADARDTTLISSAGELSLGR
jgi:hypothetical protein